MKIEGVVFKAGEVPKTLFKIVSGTVRETRNKTYHDLGHGDYVALLEYLLEEPIQENIVATEETEIIEVSLEDEYLNIIKRIIELRKVIFESSIDLEDIVLDDFNFEKVDIDKYLEQVESLLTLSAGDLPDDRDEALRVIESLDDDKIITKVNLVRSFIEKFPEEEEGARLLIETAAKVYIVLNDRYVAKSLLKKLLLHYSDIPKFCYEAIKTLEGIYRDEGNIIWRRYNKIAKILEVKLRGND
ncbi:MAG TPA: cyclic nucleotide-binding domain-containing protein [Fervidobacterium sp.]|nr:Crp/Fnr family transcriptional regulator [Fervidobacterium sp.]HOK88180.1 cyclic nucleotide-binding domain-containing protein [Fervidobacterium sp.]HOM74630.1 cyclic nucleotide-binding domain-containing protein [Fervidobacterium sp.]HOQ39263.1 cyclic nucleotide-binding domain-containing protein [Fervidobacterium sp.]HPT53846.1 cyclic nucleotide-binding domain-containing protein [Fervidobacterium sp.]